MRIAVLDDDQHETEEILNALHGWDTSRNIENFNSGEALLSAAKQVPSYTVVFFDIFLPKENGLEIAKKLHELSPNTEIVFTTTSRDFAVEAYSINALHYIVKPVTTDDIRMVFDRITKKQQIRKSICIVVGKSDQLLYLDEIVSAQSHDHRMIISLNDGTEYEAYMKCGELSGLLGKDFILLQRGFLINADFIKRMNTDSCILRDGRTILFSRKSKGDIRKAYNEYVFSRVSAGMGRRADE